MRGAVLLNEFRAQLRYTVETKVLCCHAWRLDLPVRGPAESCTTALTGLWEAHELEGFDVVGGFGGCWWVWPPKAPHAHGVALLTHGSNLQKQAKPLNKKKYITRRCLGCATARSALFFCGKT